jgi:Ca2+-binding EF-hand superfamily protein
MMTTPTKDVDFEAEMKSAFKVFDHDGSGTISMDELRRVMKSFGEILTEDELDAMIKEVDKNGDGSIDCMFSSHSVPGWFQISCANTTCADEEFVHFMLNG